VRAGKAQMRHGFECAVVAGAMEFRTCVAAFATNGAQKQDMIEGQWSKDAEEFP